MTKEQFIDKYNGKAVWCKTEELAKGFLKEASMFGFKWYPEDELTKYSNYHYCNNETCYFADKIDFTIAYASLGYAKSSGYEIIEYKPEEQEEKPKNLIPLIAKELGVEIGEEFKIKGWSSYPYKFDGVLLSRTNGNEWEHATADDYEYILTSECTIQKLPKKPILTEDEKVILRNLPKEYKWIVRESLENENNILIFKKKPIKDEDCWGYGISDYEVLLFNHLFQFIKWENEEPYSIEELLKGE